MGKHYSEELKNEIIAKFFNEGKSLNSLEKEYNIESKMNNCNGCSNNCEMVWIYKNNKVIDYWGNKCKNVLNV